MVFVPFYYVVFFVDIVVGVCCDVSVFIVYSVACGVFVDEIVFDVEFPVFADTYWV